MSEGRLLAVDCSLRITGVALAEDGRTVAFESMDLGRRQSAELSLMAERLLAEAGWSFNDIRLVAVTNGPGYFTGIRVGSAWASALAYGLGAGIVLVSSLEMLAHSRRGGDGVPPLAGTISEGRACLLPVVYAGQGMVYAASFGCDNPLVQGEYGGAEIAGWLATHGDATVISDDVARASGALGLELPVSIQEVRPDVRALAELAWARRDSVIPPMELRLSYCRSPL